MNVDDRFLQYNENNHMLIICLEKDDFEKASELFFRRSEIIEGLKVRDISFDDCNINLRKEIISSEKRIKEYLDVKMRNVKTGIQNLRKSSKANNYYNYQRNNSQKFYKKV